MDPDAPRNVAQGTAITCLTSATLSCVYGTVRKQPIGPLAALAALNSGIVAATFFGLREYAVSPLLLASMDGGQFARRKAYLAAVRAKAQLSSETLSWSEMRVEKLPDTAISSALAGGLFNGWKRGLPGVMPGAITATLFCSLLQIGYNELRIWRVEYVTRHTADAQPSGVSQQRGAAQSSDASEPEAPFLERVLLPMFGMKRVSTEEHLAKLTKQRDEALRRIAELEAVEAGRSSTEEERTES